MPHDLNTWGFILSVAALLLAVPLGIAAALLTPKVRLWWFFRSLHGTAKEILALTALRDEVRREPLFTATEELLFEQQVRLTHAVHFLAYVVVLAVFVNAKWVIHLPWRESWHLSVKFLFPPALMIGISELYFGWWGLKRLDASSPTRRRRLEERIRKLLDQLGTRPVASSSPGTSKTSTEFARHCTRNT